MKKSPQTLFWDVDTQVDFMLPEGRLFIPGAHRLIPNLRRLTEAAREHGIPVVASADDHRLADPEISTEPDFSVTYPPHCLHGTLGQEKIPETRLPGAVVIGHRELGEAETRIRLSGADSLVILKKTTDIFSNPNTERLLTRISPRHIVVYGVALDVCDLDAVEGLWRRGYRALSVVTDAVEAIDPARGERILEDWRNRGIELVTTEAMLDRLTARAAPPALQRAG